MPTDPCSILDSVSHVWYTKNMTTNTTTTTTTRQAFLAIEKQVCARYIEKYHTLGLSPCQYSAMLRLARKHNISI